MLVFTAHIRLLCSSISSSTIRTHARHSTFSSKRCLATYSPPFEDLPLSGIRILELGQVIAGPFCGQLLSQFGAEIIKIESPKGGDPLRVWRELDKDGTSPWFRSIGRNKKSVAIDLKQEAGRALVKQLAIRSDVVIENFRPGTLEKWDLGPASIHPHNPDVIYTRVSGYGQTGPWAPRPGFASVCEAESGFRFINGIPDEQGEGLSGPPIRPNISLGDSVAGLHAAFGTVLALLSRTKKQQQGKTGGTIVDVSIFESMLNLMEGIIPEYDRKGKLRGPSGSSLTGIVPTNAYECRPDPLSSSNTSFVVIGANGDSLYTRLMTKIERLDLIGPDYAQNHDRLAKKDEIEHAITKWTKERTVDEVVRELDEIGVPVGKVANVKTIVESEHTKARGAVQEVWVEGKEGMEGWSVKVPGTFPVIEGCSPAPKWAGPELGQHTVEILKKELHLPETEILALRDAGVIR